MQGAQTRKGKESISYGASGTRRLRIYPGKNRSLFTYFLLTNIDLGENKTRHVIHSENPGNSSLLFPFLSTVMKTES